MVSRGRSQRGRARRTRRMTAISRSPSTTPGPKEGSRKQALPDPVWVNDAPPRVDRRQVRTGRQEPLAAQSGPPLVDAHQISAGWGAPAWPKPSTAARPGPLSAGRDPQPRACRIWVSDPGSGSDPHETRKSLNLIEPSSRGPACARAWPEATGLAVARRRAGPDARTRCRRSRTPGAPSGRGRAA